VADDTQEAAISFDQLAAEAGVVQPTFNDLVKATRPEPVNSALDYIRGLGDAIQNGMTLGFKDEVQALGGMVGTTLGRLINGEEIGDIGTLYDQEVAVARETSKRFKKESPISSLVGEIGGGVATGAPVAVAKGTVTTLQAIARGVGFGGVAGAGFSEGDVVDRAVGTGVGAATGGLLGGATHVTVRAIERFFTGKMTKVDRTAFKNLIQAFEDDGIPVEEAIRKLKVAQESGAKPEVLADFGGDNVRGILARSIATPGPARTQAKATFEPREAGQAERVFQDAIDALIPNQNYKRVAIDLKQSAQNAAKPFYEKAYSQPLADQGQLYNVNDLLEVMNRPTIKQSYKVARKIAQDRGDPLPEIMDKKGNIVDTPDVETIDYIKKMGIDAVLNKKKDGLGRIDAGDPEVRSILDLKTQLMDIVDDLSPDYKKARALYAGDMELASAVQFGEDLIKNSKKMTNFDRIADQFNGMSASERDFARIGVARYIADVIENAPDTMNALSAVAKTPRIREVFQMVMPNEKAAERFARSVEREREMFLTSQRVGLHKGSRTNVLQSEAANFIESSGVSGSDILTAALTGDVRSAAGRAFLRMAATDQKAIERDMAEIFGRALMASEPESIARFLVRLERFSKQQVKVGAAESGAIRGAAIAAPGDGEGLTMQ